MVQVSFTVSDVFGFCMSFFYDSDLCVFLVGTKLFDMKELTAVIVTFLHFSLNLV